MKPLYGLSDSGDCWFEPFAKFHIHTVCMEQATGDFDLSFRRCADSHVALSGAYVDDVIQASPASHKAEIGKQIKEQFQITMGDAPKFVYTGFFLR